MLAQVSEGDFVVVCVFRPDSDTGAPPEPTDPPRNQRPALLQILHGPSASSGPGRLEERQTQTDGIESSQVKRQTGANLKSTERKQTP